MPDTASRVDTKELRRLIDKLPRVPLAHLPTLEFLPRFTKVLGGPRVHIKRDDCTGLAMGGNKTRHLEFWLGDARAKNADMFVWGAGVQSNNCRQTTAACAKAGIDCHLVLGRGRRADGPDLIQGNLLLDHLLGATYEINELAVGDGLSARVAEIADNFRAKGRTVYHFDPHVTEPLAAASYMLCMAEIVEQTSREGFVPDAVYISSAGGTGAGMALAARALGYSFPVRSICPIRWERDTQADMLRVADEIAERLGLATRLELDDIDVNFDYIPPGYNKASAGGLEAIALLARTEGVLLDPAYTGKAMAGLIDHSRQGKFAEHENVVFVHTGGTPALFAYNDELTSGIAGRTR